MRVELHCHTDQSDAIASVRDVVRVAEQRVDALAITDPNTFRGFRIAKRLTTPLILIPGIEVSTNEGHVLCIGIDALRFTKGQSVPELVEAVHDESGIAIFAHPFRLGRRLRDPTVLTRVDAIETLNGNTPAYYNHQASRAARRYRKPAASGSDAHRLQDIGSFAFDTPAETIDDIICSILKRRIILPRQQPTLVSLAVKKTHRQLCRLFR